MNIDKDFLNTLDPFLCGVFNSNASGTLILPLCLFGCFPNFDFVFLMLHYRKTCQKTWDACGLAYTCDANANANESRSTNVLKHQQHKCKCIEKDACPLWNFK